MPTRPRPGKQSSKRRRAQTPFRGQRQRPGERDVRRQEKNPPWTVECVLKILCRCAKNKVTELSKTDVSKYDKIFYDDPFYDGTKWVKKRFDGAGSWNRGTEKLKVISGYCCDHAAVTFFHELTHKAENPPKDWPHPSEDDTYAQTEQFTIDCQLPSQGSAADALRKTGADGKQTVDKDAIKKFVTDNYPEPKTAAGEIVVGKTATDQTMVMDPKTGKTSVRPPKKGDSFAGPEMAEGEVKIDKAGWKC